MQAKRSRFTVEEAQMFTYVICRLEGSGRICRTAAVFQSDMAAFQEARKDHRSQGIEIWQGPRMVSRIGRDYEHATHPLFGMS